jgi:(R)-2-hydroxyglutarate---pyruvate transhydrogenase
MTSITHRSSGYDLKQLFIGAEGTLGVVTGVSILTPPAPSAVNNVILALPTFENVLPLFKLARRHLSEILSAFEYIDRTAYELAVKHGQGKGLGDEEIEGAECFVLLETSGGKKEHDEEVRIRSYSECSCGTSDKVMSFEETQQPPRNTSRVRTTLDHDRRTLSNSWPIHVAVEVA